MKNLRYICVQPAIDYYAWQVEVMIHNFKKHGINPNNIDIICAIKNNHIPDKWKILAATHNNVRFFFYNDERVKPVYISSVRPHILRKHFAAHPELTKEAIFYHDCDIIFTKKPDWSKFLNDDIWYLSDTRFYISAQYIKSKKFGIYEKMCEIIGIPENVPEENELDSGGAQYIMKNVDATYWEKVEHDSEELYQYFLDHLKEHPQSPEYHPIQKWTADMWAVLWNGWYFGHTTKVVPEMEFAWPTQGLDMLEKCTILHNAGVVGDKNEKLFYKGAYQNKLPYDIKLEDYDNKRGTIQYVQEILETAAGSCLTGVLPAAHNPATETFVQKENTFRNLILKYGSDKVGNGYAPVYDTILKNIRNKPIKLLEIGIGTMKPNVPSSMTYVFGENGAYTPGASLRAFRDYFPNGEIYGGDIQDDCMFTEERITTLLFDSTSKQACDTALRDLKFDVIIDDGLHTATAQIETFKNLWERLNEGGVYFIEDVHRPLFSEWKQIFSWVPCEKWEYSNGIWTFLVFSK
jgi:hypothetical protein